MKQCVIFDMDGVVIDSEPMHNVCEKEIFQLLGISVSEEQHSNYVGSTDEIMWSHLIEMHGLSVDVSDIIQMKKALYIDYLKQKSPLHPISHIPELIYDLHKNDFIIVLASSSPHEQINYILDNIGLKQYFHSIISGEDVTLGKPHPAIFLKAAKSVGFDPKDCIVIEDSYNGVAAAKGANMKCIAFKNPNSGNQDLSKADLIVSSIKDITIEILS